MMRLVQSPLCMLVEFGNQDAQGAQVESLELLSGRRVVGGWKKRGCSKITEVASTIGVEEDIVSVQVTMQDAFLVKVI